MVALRMGMGGKGVERGGLLKLEMGFKKGKD